MINRERVLRQIEKLGEIGWEEGRGMNRRPFSADYVRSREFVRDLMTGAGMETRVDTVGNLFGRYAGTVSGTKTILSGSHLDAVPEGGKYDGPLGVLGALEAARYLHESGNRHPLEVVAFIAEEGGEMGGTFGSRCFAGSIDMGNLPPEKEMNFLGLSRRGILDSRGNPEDYEAYVELHIEQGPVLEADRKHIGIPYAIAGITRYSVIVEGVANHAGTTPMERRSDAMKETAELLTKWYDFAFSCKGFVSNIGILMIRPGSPAIIPGSVEFVLEMRSTDQEIVEKGAEKMRSFLDSIKKPMSGGMRLLINKAPASLDPLLRRTIASACDEAGYSHCELPSGAMHDAAPLSGVIPSAMIFIPSRGGISHSRDEYSEPQDIGNGVEVLARTLQALDRR